MREPYSVGMSAVSMMSLTPNGMPWRTSFRGLLSRARASSSAASMSRCCHAWTCGSRVLILSAHDATRAARVSLPCTMRDIASTAVRSQGSFIQPARRASLDLYSRLFDDLRVFLGFLLNERAELLGRHDRNDDALRRELLGDLRVLHGRVHSLGDLVDYRTGGPRRNEERKPPRNVEIGHARLGDGRHIGQ